MRVGALSARAGTRLAGFRYDLARSIEAAAMRSDPTLLVLMFVVTPIWLAAGFADSATVRPPSRSHRARRNRSFTF
jgi:hypothetical protein